ncbi:MAG TPA: hypothetical protein VJT09_07515 [Pyrinomonadaceae bacterium]|nr:hypothetical protein [Pyrinomonadaceae bacterium]
MLDALRAGWIIRALDAFSVDDYSNHMNNEPSEDVILEGAAGIYRRIDLSSAPADTSSLIPFDSDLNSLGFKLVGDMILSSLSGFLRCYVHSHGKTRALLLIGIKDDRLNVLGLFFDTNFPDHVSLTTTTSRAVKDMPEKGLHAKVYSWAGVHDLYQKHQHHMNELKTKYGDVLPIEDTLLSLAESIDSATVRSIS